MCLQQQSCVKCHVEGGICFRGQRGLSPWIESASKTLQWIGILYIYIYITTWLMEPGGSMPHSQGLSRGPVWRFWTPLFLQCEVVGLTPNPQATGPLVVGCPWLLIQYIPSLPPYLEAYSSIRNPGDTPCRGDRNPRME